MNLGHNRPESHTRRPPDPVFPQGPVLWLVRANTVSLWCPGVSVSRPKARPDRVSVCQHVAECFLLRVPRHTSTPLSGRIQSPRVPDLFLMNAAELGHNVVGRNPVFGYVYQLFIGPLSYCWLASVSRQFGNMWAARLRSRRVNTAAHGAAGLHVHGRCHENVAIRLAALSLGT